ncbi:MAG: YfiR family protein [Verrucomicrobium sp.]
MSLGLLSSAWADSREYEVKAVFLFNFSQFIKWPPRAFTDPSAPLTIGVLGDDPIGSPLQSAIRGETSAGRKLIVKTGRRIDDLKGCQFIFVSKSESGRLAEILSALQGTSVLTVGESDQFCSQGGIINFSLQGGKVGFEINVAAAQRAGLEVSPKLLRLGRIYRGG